MAMSEPNYIDLADAVIDYTGVGSEDIQVGIHEALAYLDSFPDHVPGRTIAESELDNICDEAWSDTREYDLVAIANGLGITVVPDPEPTNAEKLETLLCSVSPNASRKLIAQYLDRSGVKAGGDDEH